MQCLARNRSVAKRIVCIFAIILIPVAGVFAQDDKKDPPVPVTTRNPDIPIEELEHRLQPLTRDDLAVEAQGWLQVLKKHVGQVSDVQIKALKAEGAAKTELLKDFIVNLTRSVKERFDAAGVSIPFPQRGVHMHPVAAA